MRSDAEIIQRNAEQFVNELRKNCAERRALRFSATVNPETGVRLVIGETAGNGPWSRKNPYFGQIIISQTIDPADFEAAVRKLLQYPGVDQTDGS